MLMWLALGGLGKTILWLWSLVPKPSMGSYLDKLFECDLCLGVWLYFGMAWIFKLNALDWFIYIPIVSEFITGALMSTLVFLISEGWNARFRDLVVN